MSAVSIHLRKLRLYAKRRRVDAESILEAEFEREALSTERLRVLVLIIVIATGLSFCLISPAFFSEELARGFHGRVQSFAQWRFIVLLVLIVYLIAEHIMLGRRIRSGRRTPTFYRYLTAFIETSCPTAEIMVAASYTDSVAALTTIPVFIYSLFIVLSALGLYGSGRRHRIHARRDCLS